MCLHQSEAKAAILVFPYMWTFWREDKFSSFFRSSPDLKLILPNSPDFYMFTSQMCRFAPCAFRPTKQDAIRSNKMQLERHACGLLNPLHSAEVVDSHFKVCFSNFIYPPRVDYFTLGCSLFVILQQ